VLSGIYCGQCKRDSQPGSKFCGTCGRPLRRFSGPRGVEWSDERQLRKRPRRWAWTVAVPLVIVVILAVIGAAANRATNATAVPPVTAVPSPVAVSPRSSSAATSDVGGWTLSIRGVHDPYVSQDRFLAPPAGQHDVAVDVEMRNISGKVQPLPVPFGFSITDAAGHSYPVSLLGSMRSPVGGTGPGADLRGLVLFAVRDGSKGLALVFAPDPFVTPARFAIG
jgi:hypothetical protein